MVIKLHHLQSEYPTLFESSVISYGNQTLKEDMNKAYMFESSVISYGNQTVNAFLKYSVKFESSVISYGNQT